MESVSVNDSEELVVVPNEEPEPETEQEEMIPISTESEQTVSGGNDAPIVSFDSVSMGDSSMSGLDSLELETVQATLEYQAEVLRNGFITVSLLLGLLIGICLTRGFSVFVKGI